MLREHGIDYRIEYSDTPDGKPVAENEKFHRVCIKSYTKAADELLTGRIIRHIIIQKAEGY